MWYLITFAFGAWFGILIMCILAAGKENDHG